MIINLIKSYLAYLLGLMIVVLLGYVGYLKYDNIKSLNKKNNEITSLNEEILLLDANVSSANALLKKSKDDCKNAIAEAKQNTIQSNLDRDLKELEHEEPTNENNVGHYTVKFD